MPMPKSATISLKGTAAVGNRALRLVLRDYEEVLGHIWGRGVYSTDLT